MIKKEAAKLLVQLYADYSVLCSKYGHCVIDDGSDLESKYCPNCGAKMDGGTQNV